MKIKYQLFILIAIINLSCVNQNINTKASVSKAEFERKIVYGDNVIEATLSGIQEEGRALKGKLEFQNKTSNKVSFQLKDFAFSSGNNKGVLPNKNLAQKEVLEDIPNFENMTKKEQSKKLKELREYHFQKIKKAHLLNLVITLKPYEKITKEIEVDFQKEIEVEKLKFYFNGQYKSLLNL